MNDAVLLWWILSFLAVLFMLLDWHHAPIDITMHIGFLLIAAFMGPLGALLYVLTAREPIPGTHAKYIAPLWKQVVGSTFHCVAGDSVGIVGAAVITSVIHVSTVVGLLIEYAAGFLVGWLVFQSLFMKDMVGGSYTKALRTMFMPEWLSMNGVMAGMAVVMVLWMRAVPRSAMPSHSLFWLVMSMALVAGALVAYPINWWLVSHQLKHGLMSTAGRGMHMAMGHGLAGHRSFPPARTAHDVFATPPQDPSNGRSHHPIGKQSLEGRRDGRSIAVHGAITRPYHTPIVWISAGLLVLAFVLAMWLG